MQVGAKRGLWSGRNALEEGSGAGEMHKKSRGLEREKCTRRGLWSGRGEQKKTQF